MTLRTSIARQGLRVGSVWAGLMLAMLAPGCGPALAEAQAYEPQRPVSSAPTVEADRNYEGVTSVFNNYCTLRGTASVLAVVRQDLPLAKHKGTTGVALAARDGISFVTDSNCDRGELCIDGRVCRGKHFGFNPENHRLINLVP